MDNLANCLMWKWGWLKNKNDKTNYPTKSQTINKINESNCKLILEYEIKDI